MTTQRPASSGLRRALAGATLALGFALPAASALAAEGLNPDADEILRSMSRFLAGTQVFSVTADVPYTDVWTFPTVGYYAGKHPCEKPQAMLRHIIAASSRPNAVVLDPFAGSGSTGEAALALGRQFVGIEMSEHWVAKARERIAPKVPEPDLFREAA
jgi:hypothetical protein